MLEATEPPLDIETIRRIAREQVGISLSNDEVAAIKTLLDGLLAEIRLIAMSDRASAEPETVAIVEEWPS
jgi:hypothetical protein